MSPQWLMFGLSTFVYIITGVAAILRVGWILSKANSNIEEKIAKATADFELKLLTLKSDVDTKIDSKISIAKEEGDQKRQRIYSRFDEYKNFVETSFVRRDMCGLLHASTAQAVEKMIAKVDAVEAKLDELRTLVLTQGKERI